MSAASRRGAAELGAQSAESLRFIAVEAVAVCMLCGSRSSEVLWSDLQDPVCGLPGSFALVRCSACGLVYLNPRPTPDSIARCYPDNYPSHLSSQTALHHRLTKTIESALLRPYSRRYGRQQKTLLTPFGTRRCLDVGCGQGHLLARLREAGWDVAGLDLSGRAVAAARQRVGNDAVKEGTLQTVPLPENHFDMIILWHALEHLDDPRGSLEIVHRVMRPGGRLLLALPNIGSWEAMLFGRYWTNLDAPRHLFHFSLGTVTRLLSATGFRVTCSIPQPNPATISSSAAYFLAKHGVALPRVLRRLVHLAALPLAAAACVLGEAGNIEISATKDV